MIKIYKLIKCSCRLLNDIGRFILSDYYTTQQKNYNNNYYIYLNKTNTYICVSNNLINYYWLEVKYLNNYKKKKKQPFNKFINFVQATLLQILLAYLESNLHIEIT